MDIIFLLMLKNVRQFLICFSTSFGKNIEYIEKMKNEPK